MESSSCRSLADDLACASRAAWEQSVTRLGVCRDSAGFTFGRFGPRIAPTTVELALLGLAHLQSRSATLKPRRF